MSLIFSSLFSSTFLSNFSSPFISLFKDKTDSIPTIPEIGGNLLARFSAIESDFSLVGNEIASWEDIGSGLYDALGHSSDGTKRPLYSATGWNGTLPCVTFDGTNDYLYFGTDIPYAAGYEVFAVVSLGVVTGANRNILGSSGAGGPTLTCDSTSKIRFNRQSQAVLAIYSNTLSVDQKVIVGARTTGAGAGTAVAVYKDGVLEQQGASAPSFTLGIHALGAQAAGGTYSTFLNGKVGEILIYDGTLSGVQRALIIDYLRATWGI